MIKLATDIENVIYLSDLCFSFKGDFQYGPGLIELPGRRVIPFHATFEAVYLKTIKCFGALPVTIVLKCVAMDI